MNPNDRESEGMLLLCAWLRILATLGVLDPRRAKAPK